ncbi:helix-hairpin-helix domain-containing protein [Acidithiobacillus caldus]
MLHISKESVRSLVPAFLDDETLVAVLEALNRAYRAGDPWVSDAEYDHVWRAELEDRNPEHPFLHRVEPEPQELFSGPLVHHSQRMLSTDKAYDSDKLSRFFARCEKASVQLGWAEKPMYQVQAKLDGLSGRLYPGRVLATRGDDGRHGRNISHALERGLTIIGGVEEGAGEIVVVEDYFQSVLAPKGYEHPRNFMVGFCGADNPSADHREAAAVGVAHFVAYSTLPAPTFTAEWLLAEIDTIFAEITGACPYRTDGIVISAMGTRLRDYMGATDHHHRWQIAFKKNLEGVRAVATSVVLQTGRTGIVTPVVHIEPVQLPGATVRKASGHNAAKLEEDGIGPGAVLRIVRSGEVIPTIVGVEEPSAHPVAFTHCPSCGTELVTDGRFRRCPATNTCPAQASGGIHYFFQTLYTAKGFGKKICAALAAAEKSIPAILQMQAEDFVAIGISPGVAANLADAIATAKQTPVPAARFVAALGIPHVGEASAAKLLSVFGSIPALIDEAEPNRIASIPEFGEITGSAIAEYIEEHRAELQEMLAAGIPLATTTQSTGPLAGEVLVFTGTFSRPRPELEALAREAGATVLSSVSRKTTRLFVGEKPGETKVRKAEQLGIPQATEADFPL